MANDAQQKRRINIYVDPAIASLLDRITTPRTRGRYISDLIRRDAETRTTVRRIADALESAASELREVAE